MQSSLFVVVAMGGALARLGAHASVGAQTTVAVRPSSYVTTSGADGGQPAASSMAILDTPW
jgi:hypothetical protein